MQFVIFFYHYAKFVNFYFSSKVVCKIIAILETGEGNFLTLWELLTLN
jgi:hypothetical protein